MESKISHMLVCQLCLETPKSAKLLRCFHIYCSHCLETVKTSPDSAKKNEEQDKSEDGKPASNDERDVIAYTCTVCQRTTVADQVEIASIVETVAEAVEELSTSGSACCACSKGSSEYRCLDCRKRYCASCKLTHDVIPACATHLCVKVEADGEEEQLYIDRSVQCKKHNRQTCELNCIDCETLICLVCRALDHKEHKVESIESAVDRLKPQAQRTVELLNERRADYAKEIEQLRKTREDFDRKANKLKAAAKERMEYVIALTREHYEQVIADIDQRRQQDDDVILQEINTLRDETDFLKRITDWSETMLRCAHASSLLEEIQAGPSRRLMLDMPKKRTSPRDVKEVLKMPSLRFFPAFDFPSVNKVGRIQGSSKPLFMFKALADVKKISVAFQGEKIKI